MNRSILFLVASLIVLPSGAQDVESLGVNPETGLEEIRVNLPGLPEDAAPLDMVLIPAGSFMMGWPEDQWDIDDLYADLDEATRFNAEALMLVWQWLPHRVVITKPFYLGKYEVTQAQWEAVAGFTYSYFTADANHPVEKVAWDRCQLFARKLNGLGLGRFRLPTEAEWEYSCRAGTTTRFSFGDALECADYEEVYCELADQYMWWGGNNTFNGNENGPKEVGRKLPNPWGLYDMHGNVWEICWDGWTFSSSRGPQTDPRVPVTYEMYCVVRGGHYYSPSSTCRSASRTIDRFGGSKPGFRLLRLHESTIIDDWAKHD